MAEFIEVMKRKEEMCNCEKCADCPLESSNNSYGIGCGSFISCYPKEAEKIIMNWEKPVDWTQVKVDTPILIEYNGEWKRRHFAKYKNGRVYAWNDGKTSWSVYDAGDCSYWKHAKLA